MQNTLRNCMVLTGVTAGMWMALSGPAAALAGRKALEGLTYAAVLCLLPGWLTFVMAAGLAASSGRRQVLAVLGGTAVRLLAVLGGGLAVRVWRPHLGFQEFLVWLVVFYLAALVVETRSLLKQAAA